MATMREVAERAGVSAKTVSRVLRNDRYVSDGVRRRVNAAVEELHYVPNMLAVSFRSGRDAALGVAVPDIGDPFFARIVHAVEAEARRSQTAVIVTSLGYDPAHEQSAVEALLKRQVMGLVFCPVSQDQSYLAPWLQRTPIVFVDRAPPWSSWARPPPSSRRTLSSRTTSVGHTSPPRTSFSMGTDASRSWETPT